MADERNEPMGEAKNPGQARAAQEDLAARDILIAHMAEVLASQAIGFEALSIGLSRLSEQAKRNSEAAGEFLETLSSAPPAGRPGPLNTGKPNVQDGDD
ncbi:hypothetical protein [Ruegeria atlantica]|uniref:hypothetical protein n=1 Tax=Ruegeria atlantica TaxID=81569 RepID=UPI00147CA780|nr:hypothetical protein [Ruegeria atlantica]